KAPDTELVHRAVARRSEQLAAIELAHVVEQLRQVDVAARKTFHEPLEQRSIAEPEEGHPFHDAHLDGGEWSRAEAASLTCCATTQRQFAMNSAGLAHAVDLRCRCLLSPCPHWPASSHLASIACHLRLEAA